ncbi:MAG TPA: glycerate kinase [Nitrososphaera sp.]|nr:glycerate kinase [Nitrososphaera sp.]
METHKGNSPRLVLSAIEAALGSVNPAQLIQNSVRMGRKLVIRGMDGRPFVCEKFDNAYVVGAGKATAQMSNALCRILADKVVGGAITVPYGQKSLQDRKYASVIQVKEASHPIPDSQGVQGSKNILRTLSLASKNDVVFVLISGGGSALMPLPAAGLRLVDKKRMTLKLLKSGATIDEINVVRKHLSSIKGGQLAKYAGGARIISLVLSDVIGDALTSIASGPTAPDPSTFAHALAIVRKYSIADSRDPAFRHLLQGSEGLVEETPKPNSPLFKRVQNVIIGNNRLACLGAANYLRLHSFRTTYLGSNFGGEARDLGSMLARRSYLLQKSRRRAAVVLGGETIVTMKKSAGKGGRNQEAALSAAANFKGKHLAIACVGTDGIDGNSDAAGAIISDATIKIIREKNLNLENYLCRHDSYHALRAAKSLIITGFTGTNVNDISIACASL